MRCKALSILLTMLLFLIILGEAAFAASVPCMLTSWSGRGSLLDESTLGMAIADALLFVSDADFAIVPGGDIPDNALQPGPRSRIEIEDAFAHDRTVGVCRVSARELTQMLELCISHITVDLETKQLDMAVSPSAAFPQVAGLSFRFDALAEPGKRILWIKDASGQKLSLDSDDTVFTLAASEFFLQGGYGTSPCCYETLGCCYSDAMETFLSSGTATDYTRIHRITMIGGNTDTIIESFPPWVYILFVTLLGLYGALTASRRRRMGDTKWDERIQDSNDRPLL